MNTLSVAIASYNEVHNIKDLLDHIINWADEVVVVDGNSTDNTPEIVKGYKKVKLITTDNHPNFHINKNKAIDSCTSDWILQLDCDERLTPKLKKEIKSIINSKQPANGYWIPRSNYFLGSFLTKGGQYPDYTIRLYQRGSGRLPAKSVHEQARVSGKTDYLKHPLLHFADTSFSRYLLRNNRYTTLIAQELQQKGVAISQLQFLNYFLVKPAVEFTKIYIRHRGFVDGFPGFVFALFSALRFPISYIKLYDLIKSNTTTNLQQHWD